MLRSAMDDAFGASDTAGAWDWKAAYACEARPSCSSANTESRFSAKPGLRLHGSPLSKIVGLLPTHTPLRGGQASSNSRRRSRSALRR
jgi:hypothetical protein